MVNATDRTTVQSAANPMRKWFLRGRELGTGEVRGHFVAMCLIAGGAGWYVNKVLLGAVGTNEVPVALMQRHAVALLTGFIVLGVLTRLWLAFVGAVSKDAPTGVLAPLANLASRRARGDVTSSTTESLFVASAAVANPVAVQADDSTNVASSGKSTGAGTFLLLFLIFVLALALGVVVVAVWDAPILLAAMAADMEAIAGASNTFGGMWTLAYARRFGPRYGLLSALLIGADAVVLYMVPDALTWAQALKALNN